MRCAQTSTSDGSSAGARVLVTGASGFVGGKLCQRLHDAGQLLRKVIRTKSPSEDCSDDIVTVDDIGLQTDWSVALRSVDIVVHLAAHVHQMVNSKESDARYWQVNTMGTERLAQAAAKAGVKRFVYLSSIKVNGEQTLGGSRFTEELSSQALGQLKDPYALSKYEAEKRLRRIEATTAMEVVIIRPPLVYGPGVAANFERLLSAVRRGVPLPLAWIRNSRSLVFLDNLVDCILCCLHHPAAAGQTFLVSDAEDLSTPDLIRRIAGAMGRSAKLWPCPEALLHAVGSLLGCSALVSRLTDSLLVDCRKAQSLLGWQPPYTVDQGVQATVDWYLRERHGC
ncbi:MAG: NAD-dependent epimerase/dehydratase family protein [Desulfobulbaceae bacterium]|nr:NAD-dependent epimerase/dehydratase family protein [Desulfobulbaceae bacterium]